MPLIIETVVITLNTDGTPYIAPLGLIADGPHWVMAPFKPSRTLDNLTRHPFATASHTSDVRVIAGGVTGRKSRPTAPASRIQGALLAECVSHWELEVERTIPDEQRPRFVCRVVHTESHAPWSGFNRAQAAVIECAVLVTRLHMLPPEKVEAELKYLQIAIDKTAGPVELEAWGWLMEKIAVWRASRGV
jgi:hypothetical protein